MKSVLVADFSAMLEAEGFLSFLHKRGVGLTYLDWRKLEGCTCYCDEAAKRCILSQLPASLPRLRWIDSGDYHYMSHLLALKESQPFHLLLLDHHPDDQEASFGAVLSCGSWVQAMREENPLLQDVLAIGPEGCPDSIPAGWMQERSGERVYVSLDKDVMGPAWARTDWSQGTHTPEQVEAVLGALLDGPMEVVAVDVCGGLSEGKGAKAEDLRINRLGNERLFCFLSEHLNEPMICQS